MPLLDPSSEPPVFDPPKNSELIHLDEIKFYRKLVISENGHDLIAQIILAVHGEITYLLFATAFFAFLDPVTLIRPRTHQFL
jgi:hypothetical protein